MDLFLGGYVVDREHLPPSLMETFIGPFHQWDWHAGISLAALCSLAMAVLCLLVSSGLCILKNDRIAFNLLQNI
jgi:hypothetical protein